MIEKYFDDCKSVEELNKERQILLSTINTAYAKRRKELMEAIPPFKQIPLITMTQIETTSTPVYSVFPKSDVKALPNQIIFHQDQRVSY